MFGREQAVFVYNSGQLALDRWLLSPSETSNLWVPVCCERVMRYNLFLQNDGAAYGSLVCAVCSKNVTFELEHPADLSAYGEGARVLRMLGAPKPPNVERRSGSEDSAMNDNTL